jgi:hypothetical protein
MKVAAGNDDPVPLSLVQTVRRARNGPTAPLTIDEISKFMSCCPPPPPTVQLKRLPNYVAEFSEENSDTVGEFPKYLLIVSMGRKSEIDEDTSIGTLDEIQRLWLPHIYLDASLTCRGILQKWFQVLQEAR